MEVVAADAGADDRRVAALLAPDELSLIAFVPADVSRPDDVRALFEREPTHVIHLAALQVPACRADPVRGAQVNGRHHGARHGRRGRDPHSARVRELGCRVRGGGRRRRRAGGAPPAPGHHYGVYKLANEESARVFAAETGLASIGLRPYVVYGPGRDQGLTSAPTLAMEAAARGEGYVLPYSGRSQLQYAPDVAAAFVAAARDGERGGGRERAGRHRVGGGRRRRDRASVPEVRGRIEVTGPPPFPPELDASRFVEVGEVAVTPLEEGVAATIAHFRRAV